jgi:ATP-binding cassette, subfamily B, bacterial PglK
VFEKFSFVKVFRKLSAKRKLQFCFILAVSVFASLAEVISIGAIIPFLAFISNPSEAIANLGGWNQLYPQFLKDIANEQLFFTILFVLCAIVSGCVRVYLLRIQSLFAFKVGGDLGAAIYNNVLCQPYTYHVNTPSSELIATITTKTDEVVGSVVLPSLKLFSSMLIIALLFAVIFWINPYHFLVLIFMMSFIYILISKRVKNILIKNSDIINKNTNAVVANLQESIGGIRDIIMDQSEHERIENFVRLDSPRRTAMANNQYLGLSPKLLVETLGVVLIALYAFFLSQTTTIGLEAALPVLGAIALGAQKVLPLIQQVYRTWSLLRGAQKILDDTLAYFDLENPEIPPDASSAVSIKFNNEIVFKNLSYAHSGSDKLIFKNLSITLPQGQMIGIVGETGSGKSTFLDIFMGLLTPTSGKILIDGTALNAKNTHYWRKEIAHVPQSIFLSDTTIRENIAYNVPSNQIDTTIIAKRAKLAELHKFILNLGNGYNTFVGELGIKFSGGQRQRLGIARALYKDRNVLILDEATSALDNKTEAAVIKNIRDAQKSTTILMVAHRIESLKYCDTILQIEGGKANILGSFDQYVANIKTDTKVSLK